MRIKSNLKHNLGLQHPKGRVVIPAEAVITLDDAQFAHVPAALKAHFEKGNLEFLKKPVLSKEAQAKLDAEDEAKLKAQLAEIEKRKAAEAPKTEK